MCRHEDGKSRTGGELAPVLDFFNLEIAGNGDFFFRFKWQYARNSGENEAIPAKA
jgi:hypothetical protein